MAKLRFQRYFDPAPLVRQVTLDLRPIIDNNSHTEYLDTSIRVGEVLGVTDRTVRRWTEGARLSRTLADRLAVRIGLHPVMLWPEWYDDDSACCLVAQQATVG